MGVGDFGSVPTMARMGGKGYLEDQGWETYWRYVFVADFEAMICQVNQSLLD